MATITIPGMFLTGDHASRPAANAVGGGSVYSCSDHALIYQSDGSAWSTWATLGGDVAAHTGDATDAHDASAISFTPAGTIAATDVQAAIEEVASEAGGSGGSFVDYAHVRVTSGDKTLNSASWANLDTGMDLVVDAAVGDLIEAAFAGLWNASSVFTAVDVATWVSGAGVNWFGSGEPTTTTGNGLGSWSHGANILHGFGGPGHYVVQAGDISAGTVTLRARYRVASSSTVLRANTSDPLTFTAKVFRP